MKPGILGTPKNIGLAKRLVGLLPLLTIFALVNPPVFSEPTPSAFRISVAESGVYGVSYESLIAAGLSSEPVKSAGLCLFNRDETVPIWVADGGDGVLGPGDWIEFVAQRLAGENRYFHEYSNFNIYWLRLNRNFSHRMKLRSAASAQEVEAAGETTLPLRAVQHLEQDRLLVRLSAHEVQGSEQPDLWYWAKLTPIDSDPFTVPVDLSDLDPTTAEKVSLRLHFRALSQPQGFNTAGLSDHQVNLSLNGTLIASAKWDGRATHLLELSALEVTAFAAGENKLRLSLVARTAANQSVPLVDVVMLDWIEIDYPRSGVVAEKQAQISLPPAGSPPGIVRLTAPGATSLVAYGSQGSRIEPTKGLSPGDETAFSSHPLVFLPAAGEDSYHVVPNQEIKQAEQIQPDQPSDLKSKALQGDYLMIAHERLLGAVRPLAEFHRRRGLRVTLVDVQDVYDEFNHGITHPRAIRDFAAYTHRNWLKPAPRFVLLVGDASWDTKNPTEGAADYANWTTQQQLNGPHFAVEQSVVYRNAPDGNRRNLIPTWNYHSPDGHSASDNRFVALKEGDYHPFLAIGRFPVTEPEEVRAIVEKTIRYVVDPPVGPWRRSSLWIADEETSSQQFSDRLAALASKRGLEANKIYFQQIELGRAPHQTQLRQAFDQGQFLVHFYGQGGGYFGRTDSPNLKKNHDLFRLEDLEQLKPNDRLAVVLAMTSFSTPFDHPNSDSLGERFLRLPGRGAVGVVAASWRNSPSLRFSQALVDELTQPGTVGEAILRAKQQIQDPDLVETYNLLGDPAVPVAVPKLAVAWTPTWSPEPGLSVNSEVHVPSFQGRAVVDWLDKAGELGLDVTKLLDGKRLQLDRRRIKEPSHDGFVEERVRRDNRTVICVPQDAGKESGLADRECCFGIVE